MYIIPGFLKARIASISQITTNIPININVVESLLSNRKNRKIKNIIEGEK